MLLKEIKKIFHQELNEIYGEDEVSSFFYLLIEHYLGLERFVLAIQPNLMVDKQEEAKLFKALSELKINRPIQYITGKAYFMDMEFKVGPGVLIPRPETEELVRWVVSDVTEISESLDILDMGTGSGCIAIGLAKALKNATVRGLDISGKALKLAKENTRNNEADVHFFQSDMTNLNIKQKFDIVVSNPPYVRYLEKNKMNNNVLDYEPETALFVSDNDPLFFYRSISEFTTKNLKPNGMLYLEINQYLGAETCCLLKKYDFEKIELRKDMFGNDRMIKATKN